jgi:hypothetical protein
MFAETSAMSLSFAIFSPFSLSASDLALTIKSCNCLILSTDTLLNRLEVTFEFGMSMASDYDNPVKIFQDVLSKKYGFNDNRIFAGHQYKILVPKGEEFIKFEIKSF